MFIDEGSGSSLGSVVLYWCREGYQLVGNGKLTCLLKGHISYWSHPPPHCEVIPKPLDKGFRVAVIASLISGVIIVTMSISFAVCCLRDRMLRGSEHGTSDGITAITAYPAFRKDRSLDCAPVKNIILVVHTKNLCVWEQATAMIYHVHLLPKYRFIPEWYNPKRR
ncbi:UNVERIFIED_CONTAM: hypothetical protein K2H54_074456 [Gekko kuhli]